MKNKCIKLNSAQKKYIKDLQNSVNEIDQWVYSRIKGRLKKGKYCKK